MPDWTTLIIAGLAAVILLVAVSVVAWLLGRRSWFAKWIRGPLQGVALASSVWVFCRLGDLESAEPFAQALVAAAIVGGAAYFAFSFGLTVFFSRQRDVHLPPLLRSVLVGLVFIAAFLLALKVTVPDFSLAPFLVASGVLSLVIGLAFQDVLSNFISGVTLSIERPLRKDDWVEVGGQEGKVVEITWRSTKILTRSNDFVVVPNRKLAENYLTNFSMPTRLHREIVYYGLPYTALPTVVEELLLEASVRATGVLSRPRPSVALVKFDEYSIIYRLAFYVDRYTELWETTGNLNREIYFALQRHGVEIPFPIRTVNNRPAATGPETWKENYRHRLQVLEGQNQGDRIPLVGTDLVVGRGPECQIDLGDPISSKQHARIRQVAGKILCEDLDSKHGTLVNGRPVQAAWLRSGDEITIGKTVLRFEEIVLG